MRPVLSAGQVPLRFGRTGLTCDPDAVFGRAGDGVFPAWVRSLDEVARCVARKENDDVSAAVWLRIGRLLRDVDRLPSGARLDVRSWTRLHDAIADATALVSTMPVLGHRAVPMPLLPPPSRQDARWATGPVRFVIDAVGARIAELIADPSWIDPCVLAGELTDLRDALRDYATNARAWSRLAPATARPARVAEPRVAKPPRPAAPI